MTNYLHMTMVCYPERDFTIPWVMVSLSLPFLKPLHCYPNVSCLCTSCWSAWGLSGILLGQFSKASICCLGANPCTASQGWFQKFIINLCGLIFKILPLHNFFGTFQFPRSLLFSPPSRNLGLYLLHSATHFLQME